MSDLTGMLNLRDGVVVAIIGAGGKHTLMLRIGRELCESGGCAVLTSTTNLHRSADYAALPTLVVAEHQDWQDELPPLLAQQKPAVVVGSIFGPNMYRGLKPDSIPRISDSVPGAVVLVKADGARKRLLKAPSEGEPVYPPRVDVCVLVLSLAAIGKPLDEHHVHRLERLRALTDETTVTTRTLVKVITGSGGYAGCLPKQGRNVLYLSSCDSPTALAAARAVFEPTRRLFHAQFCGDTMKGYFLSAEDLSHG